MALVSKWPVTQKFILGLADHRAVYNLQSDDGLVYFTMIVQVYKNVQHVIIIGLQNVILKEVIIIGLNHIQPNHNYQCRSKKFSWRIKPIQ